MPDMTASSGWRAQGKAGPGQGGVWARRGLGKAGPGRRLRRGAVALCTRAALRETKSRAKAPGLLAPGIGAGALIAATIAHRLLINRPIVATPKGAKPCRPSQTVPALLDRTPL
jgi:hypothetical protein